MRRGALVAGLLLLALLQAPGVCAAHALLRHASPGAGSTLAVAPRQIRITFSEDVEPAFCAISVLDAQGRHHETGPPRLDGAQHDALVQDVEPLPPGTYAVAWHATSVDTHHTEGTYHFTVGP